MSGPRGRIPVKGARVQVSVPQLLRVVYAYNDQGPSR